MTGISPNVYAIAITPFLQDGAIDRESIDRMVDFYLGCGVDGLTILGIMGEAPKLTAEESLAVTRQVIARCGSRPVIVGVSSPGFSPMRQFAREVMELGAEGVMIAPPSSLRTDDQIVTYYRQAAESIGSDVPFVIQDHPLATQVIMTPEVIRRIVVENPSCYMLKHEDWPGLEKISALRQFERDGQMRHIPIYCGNGGVFLDFEMERGADGAMTGYAFPDFLVDVVRLAKSGKRNEAHDLFDAHLPLLRYEQQPVIGLAVRKYVLQKRGAVICDVQRKPGSSLSPTAKAEIDYLLRRLAEKDSRARL